MKSGEIRRATTADNDAIWQILQEVITAGDVYAMDRDMPRDEALAYWFRPGTHTYVAEVDCSKPSRSIAGSYILRANHAGGGSHVANAAFIVSSAARGKGIGRAMGEHCLTEARRLGFRAMQFNFVISTNESAVRLWQTLGFGIVGTLPGAFRHPSGGEVDVYVMFRSLVES